MASKSSYTAEEFQSLLKSTAQEIYHQLDKLLSARVRSDGEKRLLEAMRYSALAPSKYVRPFLLLQVADLFSVTRKRSLLIACAIECIHVYSLIHDDLPAMDDDDMRRGQASCHKKFDEATAILAGNALLTFAFELVADPSTHPEPVVRCGLVSMLARSAGYRGLLSGQMQDLISEGRKLSFEEITQLHREKTAELFRFCAEAACVLGHAEPEEQTALCEFGEKLGLLFQVTDDILDVKASAQQLGKTPGKDNASDKATIIKLLGVNESEVYAEKLAQQALLALKPVKRDIKALIALVQYVLTRKS